MSKWENLQQFRENTRHLTGYDFPKETFIRIGRAALKELAKTLEDTGYISNCKIDYNRAGPVMTGDFHLRGDFNAGESFDLFFNLDGSTYGLGICYRKTKNQKDHTGGQNHWIKFDKNVDEVADAILRLKTNHTITLPIKEDANVNTQSLGGT